MTTVSVKQYGVFSRCDSTVARWCIFLLVLLNASIAVAYELYTVTDNSSLPLRWCTTEVSLHFDATPPDEIEQEAMQQAITEGFQQWSGLSCEEGVVAPFDFVFGGVVEGGRVGYNRTAGAENENLVKWVKSAAAWSHGSAVLALTSLTFDTLTGEIVDADLEINDAGFVFSLNPNAQEIDLLNTVVHEAGHVLGLDHSAVPDSTMFAKALPGETNKRTIESDDIAGFCALYGPSAERTQCLPPSAPEETGCSSVSKKPSGAGTIAFLTVLLLSCYVRYRWGRTQPREMGG